MEGLGLWTARNRTCTDPGRRKLDLFQKPMEAAREKGKVGLNG